jgi:hypothetical protein
MSESEHGSEELLSALSIGIVVGGAWANKPWVAATKRAMRRVAELRDGFASPFNVNVVFHIPGEVMVPEFEGLRSGRFSRKERTLMVQVAVPEGEPAGDPDEEVRQMLLDAIDLAEDYARLEAVIGPDERLDALRAIVAKI